jgi:CHC2 zinc finger
VVSFPSPLQFDAREIKRHADIFSIVSRYTRIWRAGRQYLGLCPFHSERHPSFYIEPDRKLWKCFGCGLGGDVLAFVMRIEGCDFRHALGILAKHSKPGNSSGVTSRAPGRARPESFVEAAARVVASLPSPDFVPSCPRCSSQMEFQSYRGNRFGGAYHCASCSVFFGPRELRKKLFTERGAVCQWCRVSSESVHMHHVLKNADPFDPAFIVLLCSRCRGNVRKLLAIQRGILRGRSPQAGERSEPAPLHSQSRAERGLAFLSCTRRITFSGDAQRRSVVAKRRRVASHVAASGVAASGATHGND